MSYYGAPEPLAQRRTAAYPPPSGSAALAQHGFGLPVGPPLRIVEHESPAAASNGARPPLSRAPARGSPAARHGRGPAAPRFRRSARRARPAPRPAHRHARSASACRRNAAATTPQQSNRRVRRRAPRAPARRSGSGETFWRAGLLNGGFISTRSAEPGPSPRAANSSAGAVTSSVTARTRRSRPLRAIFVAAMCDNLRIDFHERHVDLRTAHRQRQTRRANARAEIDHAVAGTRVGRRRKQDGVVADAVAALLLREPQPAAEHRIVGRLRLRTARCPAAIRGLGPHPPATGARRPDAPSSTTMRRGSMPSEPSSTLMCRSSTTCGISAPLSSASIAVISTALLVRTSSRIGHSQTMTFSENRFPLFGVMVQLRRRSSAGPRCAR